MKQNFTVRQGALEARIGAALFIREIAAVLRRSCPGWAYIEVSGPGHMAPLTRPDLINPLVR